MTGENAFAELIHEYVGECLPLAEQAADGLLEVERRWNAGQPVDDLAPRLKGLVHTVKGNSAMMGQSAAAEVSHALEDLFASMLADASRRDPATLDLLLDGANLLIDLVHAAASGKTDAARAGSWVQAVRAQLAGQAAPAAMAGTSSRASGAPEAAIDTVRVDFRRLDALQEIVGEAIIAQSRLRDIQRRMTAHLGFTEETAELDASINAVEKTTQRLEDAVMATRLVPLSGVFGRYARLVRDVAQSSGKLVRLETAGGETRLDKAIVDRLGEPLVHLITNAVVHGVEREEVRRKQGKVPEAVIRLHAAPVSDGVILTVSDDGSGLDADRIAERARALGLEVNSTAPDAIHPLIFVPGLSTVASVSSLAGRGVGLDVVAGSLHAMGGSITVESAPGRGTRFILRVPVTLAVVRTLLFEVSDERYAIPLAHVVETVRVEDGDIHEINHRGVVLWRGELLPVVDGAALVGAGTMAGEAARKYTVVVHAGTRRRGVLVDRLLGHRSVVAKGLDPALGHTRLVSGTTIMGDGRVTCILDAQRLVDPLPGHVAAVS
jgi:two-component system chemotaxis sensor kinase CheA